ncbi:MAG: leucine-rich repeat domain-containing protein, partial [Muribaculum sp.]|nr:leucine-rich repeat domain-containing protein [Muribaculum sp.]
MDNNTIKFQLPYPACKYKVNNEAFSSALVGEHRDGTEVTLTFESPVTSVGSNAVVPCRREHLTALELPESVESINGRSFGYIPCKNIKCHMIDEDGFVIKDGTLIAIFANDTDKIIIPDGVKAIGPHVINKEYDGEIVFPKTLLRIENHAFDGCVCKYKLNKGLKYVGDAALRGINNKTLTIPTTVDYIGDYGFADYHCTQKIVIKHNISHIGRGAFCPNGKSNLQKVEGVYATEDGLMLIRDGILLACVIDSKIQSSSIVVPEEVKILDEQSFAHCNCSILLPDGLLEIRKGAFWGNGTSWLNGLKLNIPDSVEKIEDEAFGRAYLKVSGKYTSEDGNCVIVNGRLVYMSPNVRGSLNIPQGTESIAPYAYFMQNVAVFDKCFPKNLEELKLPSDIKYIDKLAFGFGGGDYSISINTITIDSVTPFDWDMGCITTEANIFVPDESVDAFKTAYPKRANNIKGKSENADTNELEVNGIHFTYQGKKLIGIQTSKFIQEIEIPEQTEEISDNLNCQDFKRSQIKKINFPESLRRIGNYAFAYFGNLRTINLPKNLQEIGDESFSGCALGSLSIPNSVKSIGTKAFSSNNMKKVKLGKGLIHIGENAFAQCYQLKKIEGKFSTKDGKMLVCDGNLIWATCDDGEDLIIPDGVTKLPEWCHISNNINRMIIPEGVKHIPENFYTNGEINTVVLPQSLETIAPDFLESTSIGKFEGHYTTNNGKFVIIGNRLLGVARKDIQKEDNLKIPEYVEIIGEMALHGSYNFKCNLIELPSSLHRIEDSAFKLAENYRISPLPETLEYIGDEAFMDIQPEIFSDGKIIIPKNVKEIGKSAFNN